jgi:hypothetical protein
MKPPRSALKLPRYTLRKRLANGQIAYFFSPKKSYYDVGCTVEREALGTDYDAAIRRVEDVLLPAFDSWLTGGLSDLVPVDTARTGTFNWLVTTFKASRKFTDTDSSTRTGYEKGLRMVAEHVLQDGSKVGSKMVSDFSTNFVDALYDKLLIVEEKDEQGNPVKRERRRMTNGAMVACRRAWNVAQRAEPTIVPAINPFSRMGLKATAPGQMPKETPTATWEQLCLFRKSCIDLSFFSLATAALVSWEWLQRVEHIFGNFDIAHYRPRERPNGVRVVHPKTGEEAWWPLFNDKSVPLFPELMLEVDDIKKRIIGGLAFRRDHKHRRSGGVSKPWITERGDLDHLRSTVKDIMRHAGLPEDLSFTSFRHGGFTEGADSDWTDAELRAAGRHRSAKQLPTYAKRTQKQLISATEKRRIERTKAGDESE